MKFSHAMLFGLALIVGVAIGYMFNPSVEAPPAAKHERPQGAIKDEGDAASLKALRARIAELEAKLSEKSAAPEKSEEKVEGKKDQRGPGRGWGGLSPKEWREKMKKENPEQYAQMTNGMARWRRERLEQAQKKAGFLASIDVSRMSASARKTHTELQDLIAKREELEQKMQDLGEAADDMTPEERHAMWQEIHQVNQQIGELNAKERNNLMVETAKNLGFNEAEADEVAEAFQEIIENTEGGFNATGRPGRGPGGPGGMPPPPR